MVKWSTSVWPSRIHIFANLFSVLMEIAAAALAGNSADIPQSIITSQSRRLSVSCQKASVLSKVMLYTRLHGLES